MKFTTSRENLLTPLQQVIGVIERRQTMPILANVLIKLSQNRLEFTGTDLEVQLVTHSLADSGEDGETTVPARKFLDICRQLPDKSEVSLECRQDRLSIQCLRSRFSISTLPAGNYPEFEHGAPLVDLALVSRVLKSALEKTIFAMAIQDVRYYLNGLLLEVGAGLLRTVSSDGHRLALYQEAVESAEGELRQIIIPRKGVLELYRLLDSQDALVNLQISSNNVRFLMGELSFSAKLIEGRFPDFQRVMPTAISRVITVDKEAFKGALTRVAILSNEKLKGVSLDIGPGVMGLSAQNPEHEEAEESIEIQFEGEAFSVAFNAAYLLDAINNVDSGQLRLSFTNEVTSCLVEDVENDKFKFIVMPMRL